MKRRAIEWREENLDDTTRHLIAQAAMDLYFGCSEDDYPGFERACKEIKHQLRDAPRYIFLDHDSGCWITDEPDADDGGEWYCYEWPQIIRAIVGCELGEYVR